MCCEVCINISEIDTFTVTGKTHKENNKLNCGYKCLMYLLKGNYCRKQYSGETSDSFSYRQ